MNGNAMIGSGFIRMRAHNFARQKNALKIDFFAYKQTDAGRASLTSIPYEAWMHYRACDRTRVGYHALITRGKA